MTAVQHVPGVVATVFPDSPGLANAARTYAGVRQRFLCFLTAANALAKPAPSNTKGRFSFFIANKTEKKGAVAIDTTVPIATPASLIEE